MYLKSIELNGFKSFAKKSELIFSSPISAIVGPNGSGKSNIAEAFRFVLGEQSIKSLRGKKGEDLIWNGAGDTPRSNRASVKVIFDNSTKFLPVDFEEVVIERIVHRDSVNEYLINNSQVRLKDVIELLSSAHIGASGHNIISQGEADRILGASIKERKTIIEDALGLKLYQYKKQESQKKLEKTRENIEKTQSLRREIAPHLKFLKKQVEKVQKSLEMKEELSKLASDYFSNEDRYIKISEKRISEEKIPLENLLNKMQEELSLAKAVIEKTSDGKGDNSEILEIEIKMREIREQKDSLFKEFGRIDGELSSLSRMIIRQKEVANSYAHKTVPLSSIEDVQNKIENKILSVKDSVNLDELLSAINEIGNIIKDFVEDNKDKVDMSLLSDAQKDANLLEEARREIEQKIKDIKLKESELSEKQNIIQNKIEREKNSNIEAEKTVLKIMAEEGNIRSKLTSLQIEEENLRSIKENFKKDALELVAMLGSQILHFSENDNFELASRSDQEVKRKNIERIKIRLEDVGGGGSDVVKEYKEATERDEFLEKELLDLEKSAESLNYLIKDLDEKLSNEFKNGVEKINSQFREYFAMMFGGGDAKLTVIKEIKKKKKDDTEEIFSEDDGDISIEEQMDEGIDIEVNLPKKKVKGLVMLSGGERALTSIALIFAITQVNPPPFIILDETDAALDEANSKKYADMVENLSNFSQLIVITHNRETMSRAGILYGVTMASGGGSRLLSVAFEEAVAVAK